MLVSPSNRFVYFHLFSRLNGGLACIKPTEGTLGDDVADDVEIRAAFPN